MPKLVVSPRFWMLWRPKVTTLAVGAGCRDANISSYTARFHDVDVATPKVTAIPVGAGVVRPKVIVSAQFQFASDDLYSGRTVS